MKLFIHEKFYRKFFKSILFPIILFTTTLLIYKLIYPVPRTWYQHYLYQAQSFLKLQVDIPNLPDYYQDKIVSSGKILTPFPPMPAVILIPFNLLSKEISQQQVSVLFGAINVVLVFFLIKKFTNEKTSALVSIFFGFGTVAFWSAVVGTTWYFAHTVAITMMLLALISYKNDKYFLSGILFAMAALCRYPMIAGGVFFLLELIKEPKKLFKFLMGAFIFIPVQLGYNFLRFRDILETGYVKVYQAYVSSGGYAYTIRQLINPNLPYFGYMDIRNIPMHLYTFLIMPPGISSRLIPFPSPYGMGIAFTTPLLLLALFPNLKNSLQRNLFAGAATIAFIDFLHYMQGWVQFGYRFLLDFLPFLLIILAVKFKSNWKLLLLLCLSIAINVWGVIWGIKLGW